MYLRPQFSRVAQKLASPELLTSEASRWWHLRGNHCVLVVRADGGAFSISGAVTGERSNMLSVRKDANTEPSTKH